MFFILQVIDDEQGGPPRFNGISKHDTRAEAEAAIIEVARRATGTFYVVKPLARVVVEPTLELIP